jgi:hypothetical protein
MNALRGIPSQDKIVTKQLAIKRVRKVLGELLQEQGITLRGGRKVREKGVITTKVTGRAKRATLGKENKPSIGRSASVEVDLYDA